MTATLITNTFKGKWVATLRYMQLGAPALSTTACRDQFVSLLNCWVTGTSKDKLQAFSGVRGFVECSKEEMQVLNDGMWLLLVLWVCFHGSGMSYILVF